MLGNPPGHSVLVGWAAAIKSASEDCGVMSPLRPMVSSEMMSLPLSRTHCMRRSRRFR